MFEKKLTKIISFTTAIFVLATICLNVNVKAESNTEQKKDLVKTITDTSTFRYVEYFDNYKNEGFNGEDIIILASNYSTGVNVKSEENFKGKNVVATGEQGYVTWDIEIKKSGLYAIGLEYYPMEGNGSNIERTILIDSKIPFQEAFGVGFTRIYKDEEENPSGKIIRPNQIEAPRWIQTYVNDSFGYFGEALYFYFEKGQHTLTFNSIKEPMAISKIQLTSKDFSPKDYKEVLSQYVAKGAKEINGVLENGIMVFQAENVFEKGDPTLFAKNDSTSTKNQPFDISDKVMNVIGGLPWKYSNQWISWKIGVPESGFYNIGLRNKQNFVRDIYCNRTLYIDDKVPFKEAENVHFDYNDKWKVDLIGSDEGYRFYLEKGEHTIKLKVTTGDLEEVLTEADDILKKLNKINLDLVALMSTKPDVDRDYQIAKYMPETIEELKKNTERLKEIHKNLTNKTGKKDSLTSELEQLISLVNDMANKPEKIASLFSRFRDRVGSFGNWIMKVREQPLLIDYLFISEVGKSIPKKEDNFFNKLYTGVISFFKSFTTDYSMLSPEGDSKKAITVWIGSGLTGGRDQALALNQMIKERFTSGTGIPVNLQLVPEETILMATLAGRGPDVALQVKSSDPVDFALRNAVYDLTQFKDFEALRKRFFTSAVTPFEYNNGVYALPETMSFPMLFYRTDILQNLGIDSSSLKTWKDITEILPILQGKNMNFALPQTMPTYSMFLYQMGGSYYTKDARASNLNSKIALEAFKYWTDFYNTYSLPIDFSFENRFRTGEMPIGIAEYTTYNHLSISAPEIKGKWAMVELPGIADENGNINNTSPTTSQGCILMKSSKSKEAAWEFMKWWTTTEAQYEFGKQLEAVMGASARYNTANIEALQKMPWAAADRMGLMNQAKHEKGVPQVPGGYFTERNLNFAKLAVLNKKEDPRETLANYSNIITEEIQYKRKEFGLD